MDVIRGWSIRKIHGYIAFYIAESEEFKEKLKIENNIDDNDEDASFERIAKVLGV